MIARILTMLAVLTVVAVLAQSQPAPRDSQDTDRSTGDKQPTQPPINVTVTTPQPSPDETAREEQYRQREVVATEDVRDFTRWLTYLTFVQAFLGLAGFAVALRATKAAKQSADIARDSLVYVQRAFIRFAGLENNNITIRTDAGDQASCVFVAKCGPDPNRWTG